MFNWLFGKSTGDISEKDLKSVSKELMKDVGPSFNDGYKEKIVLLDPEQAYDYYDKSHEIKTAVDKITEGISQIILQAKDNNNTVLKGKQFKSIEVIQQSKDLIKNMLRDKLVVGSYFYEVNSYGSKPTLKHISPLDLSYGDKSYIYSTRDIQKTYKYNKNSGCYEDRIGNVLVVTIDDKRENGDSDGFGISPINSIKKFADIISASKQHEHNKLQNGTSAGSVLTSEQPLSKEQAEGINKKLSSNLGIEGKSNFVNLMGVAGVKLLPIPKNDPSFFNHDVYKNYIKSIYIAYKVPLPVISDDSATYNNYGNAMRFLYTDSIIPKINDLLTCFDKLKEILNEDIIIEVKQEAIPAVIDYKIEQGAKLKDLPLTINEQRGLMGFESVDDGDEVLVNPMLTPLSDNSIIDEVEE